MVIQMIGSSLGLTRLELAQSMGLECETKFETGGDLLRGVAGFTRFQRITVQEGFPTLNFFP